MSFNTYARKVRNPLLPMGVRASALRSCVLRFCWCIPERSYNAMLDRLIQLVGADLRHSAQESDLLAALERLERARNQIMELKRAFERKRIRQKFRGRRVPSGRERQSLSEAITAVRRAADLLPIEEPERLPEPRYR